MDKDDVWQCVVGCALVLSFNLNAIWPSKVELASSYLKDSHQIVEISDLNTERLQSGVAKNSLKKV